MLTVPKIIFVAAAAVAFVPVGAGVAQEAGRERALDRLEVTMALLPESAADAAGVARRIELPPANPSAAPEGRPNPEAGPPSNVLGQGRDTAEDARERRREFGRDVAEQARERRQNAGNGAEAPGRPDVPTRPTDVPVAPGDGGRPETPGRPASP
jgi:hypothetical protein